MESNQLQSQQHLAQQAEEIDFQKYWLVLRRRWLPAAGVLSAVIALAAFQVLMRTPVYQARGKLLFQIDRSSVLTGIIQGDDLRQASSDSDPLSTQVEIIRSKPVMSEVVTVLDIRNDNGELVSPSFISSRLIISPVRGTDVLNLDFSASDPDLTAAVVNTVMEVYLRRNVADNRAKTVAAREFIQQQLPIAEDAVRDAETALRDFKEDNQIVVLQEEASNTVSSISILNNQTAQIQAELIDKTAQALELRRQVGMSPEQAVNLSRLNQAPGVQDALAKLQEVQAQLSVERTRYRDSHPTVSILIRQEESLLNLLQQRVVEVVGIGSPASMGDLQLGSLRQNLTSELVQTEIVRLGLEQRLLSLLDTRNNLQEQAIAFPGLEQTQRELERQLKAAQTTYEALLTRLQEIRIAENQNIGNARILEEAGVPNHPVNSGAKQDLAIALILGVLLASATAFSLDLLDRSVKTAKDARELLGYDLLGIIPKFSSKAGKASSDHENSEWIAKRIVVRDSLHSPISKAYQVVQANIQVFCSSHHLKTLVVSSSVPGEGKSEVSANLAAALAQTGLKVLLVDSNMCDPSQHYFWSLSNVAGLSNVVVNHVDTETAIQSVMPNLEVLTAGTDQPNSLALLNSQSMHSLIKEWSKKYDFVIFDAPALSGNADAVTLARYVDGLVFVVRPSMVSADSIKASREFLQRANVKVIGMVANGIRLGNEPDHSFYYMEQKSSQRLFSPSSSM
jgi:succinoglycan biosynthesis transport protein ExoP